MRIKALVIRIFQQMLRDKRTLILLFAAPLFVLTLMYFIFNGDSVTPEIGIVGAEQSLIDIINDSDIDTTVYDYADKDTVINDDLDGLLTIENNSYTLIIKNSDTAVAKSLLMKINKAVNSEIQMSKAKGLENSNASQVEIAAEYVYGNSDTTIFDIFSSILIGFFIFFFVFLIAGIGLLRERTTGTLERLMSTPIKRIEVVMGYLIGYGAFAVIQTIVIVIFSIEVLNITSAGSIWYVILINLLCALVALSLGILLSTFASSEFQMMQFIPIVIIPQVFFSGIFPLDGMADWLKFLAKIMPLYYVSDALQGVMYKSYGFSDISTDLIVLLIFAAVFIELNIIALKKYRKL